MEVIRDISNLKFSNRTGVALGNFDGIHLGHAVLINKLKNLSELYGYKSVLFTFDDHTLKIINPTRAPQLLTDAEKKIELLSKYGIDFVVMIKFDKDFSLMTYEEFIDKIIIQTLNAGIIVVGYDYRFGRNGEGNTDKLREIGKKCGFDVEIVSPVVVDGIKVSSSYIRELIKKGMVDVIPKYLGRYYSLKGKVVRGMNYGARLLGYPTANIDIDEELCIPRKGVYITRTCVYGQYYMSVTNIGYNPTFSDKSLSIETYIIDYENGELYDKIIEVEFIKYIRDEIKFSSVEQLRKRINEDIVLAVDYFRGIDT